MKLKHKDNKSKFKSYRFKNNKSEYLFFGSEISIKENLNKKSKVEISNKYYAHSGHQSEWSSCNSLDELNNEILTVDQDKDKTLPEINVIGENDDKFFINCSLIHISDFFDRILEFNKKGSVKEWDERPRNISKIKSENDYLIFLISTLSGLKNIKNNFEDLNNDVKLKFKMKNGVYNLETFYFDDIFGDTEPSGFNTLGHLIKKE